MNQLRILPRSAFNGFFIQEQNLEWWEPYFKFPFYRWVFQDDKFRHGRGICMTFTYDRRGK